MYEQSVQCFTVFDGAIRLTQEGVDRFTVHYGKQVTGNLTYSDAARELGACIMHAAAGQGMLDNREPWEIEE